jgi:putative tryptophan/tyrosine transport system substrate-binding protein
MNRRKFIGRVAGVLVATPLVAKGQAAGRVYRLGILRPGPQSTSDPVLAGTFSLPLRDLGYVEGRNLVIESRYADGKLDRLPALARELADLRVDAILAVGPFAIQAAKDATTTIPIVLFTGGDPVAAGLVPSLARPGGNITGVLIAPEGTLAGKRLEMLRESIPRATRIALLVTDDSGVMLEQQISETRTAASTLGIDLDVTEVRGSDYARVFASMAARRPQALIVGAQATFLRDRKQIIELAAKYRLPAIYEWPRQVQDGGLMSYGANDVATYAQVASYIDRIFKGARPGDLPIWQPSRLSLVINLRTAQALGLVIPQSLLVRADELIR